MLLLRCYMAHCSLEDPDGVTEAALSLSLNRATLARLMHSHQQVKNAPS